MGVFSPLTRGETFGITWKIFPNEKEHFLLLCNSFTEHRHNLLTGVNDVLEAYGYSEAPENNILQLLLYGNKNLPLEANRLILNATMNYIFETERFD